MDKHVRIWVDTQEFNPSYDYWCQSSHTTFETLTSLKPERIIVTLNIEYDTTAFDDLKAWIDLFKPHLIVKFH